MMDNASVHVGSDAVEGLIDLMNEHDFKVNLLPTYSPELNPCEYVFARIKKYIQSPLSRVYSADDLREVSKDFTTNIADAVSHISKESMMETYRHCIYQKSDSDMMKKLVENGLVQFDD